MDSACHVRTYKAQEYWVDSCPFSGIFWPRSWTRVSSLQAILPQLSYHGSPFLTMPYCKERKVSRIEGRHTLFPRHCTISSNLEDLSMSSRMSSVGHWHTWQGGTSQYFSTRVTGTHSAEAAVIVGLGLTGRTQLPVVSVCDLNFCCSSCLLRSWVLQSGFTQAPCWCSELPFMPVILLRVLLLAKPISFVPNSGLSGQRGGPACVIKMLGLCNSDDYLWITRSSFRDLIAQEPTKESVWPSHRQKINDG